MAKRTPGLYKRGEIWHIDKVIAGRLFRVSTGETELENAERYLENLIKEVRRTVLYGERTYKTFNEAAAKYITEYDKKSLKGYVISLKLVMPYIGGMLLKNIHAGSLEKFVADRKAEGCAASTISRDLVIVKQVLNNACRLWRDENNNPWLDVVPILPVVTGEKRKPRPLSYAEQDILIKGLPDYLAKMTLFALNTGLRDQEICNLKWSDECKVQGLDTTVFIISEERAKNSIERIVPLNSIAMNIINSLRPTVGVGEYVFTYRGHKLNRMNNRAWRENRVKVELADVRPHDLRHTFGMRLRAVGVTYEDRQDLLGHYAGRITTHYSKVEINRLIECVELLCDVRKPELTLIRTVQK